MIRNNQSARSLAESPIRRGLAITVPFKVAVIPLLDAVDGDVEAIGAANYLTIEGAPQGSAGGDAGGRRHRPGDGGATRQLPALQELSHLGPRQTITNDQDDLKYATAGAICVNNDQLKGGLILPAF